MPEGAILRTDGDNVSIYVPMMMMDSAPPAAPHGDPMTNPTEPDADPLAAKMEREAALLEGKRHGVGTLRRGLGL